MTRMRRSALSSAHNRARLRIEELGDRRLLSVVADGPEFQVNTYTTSDQRNPWLAMDADD